MYLLDFKISHLPLLAAWLEQPDIRATFGDPAEWLEEVAANLGPGSWVHHFLVCAPEPVGFCQFYDTRQAPQGPWSAEPPGTAGIDFMFGTAAFRRQGRGPELLRLLLEKIRQTGAFEWVIADPDPTNRASVRVLEKCGFVRQPSGLYRLRLE